MMHAVRDDAGWPCGHVVALVDRHAVELDARISDVIAARAEVDRLRQPARGLDPADCAQSAVCHVIPTTSDPQPGLPWREARRQAQRAHSLHM